MCHSVCCTLYHGRKYAVPHYPRPTIPYKCSYRLSPYPGQHYAALESPGLQCIIIIIIIIGHSLVTVLYSTTIPRQSLAGLALALALQPCQLGLLALSASLAEASTCTCACLASRTGSPDPSARRPSTEPTNNNTSPKSTQHSAIKNTSHIAHSPITPQKINTAGIENTKRTAKFQ